MRKWHRWTAIPAGIFMFIIALTGVLLHLDMIRVGQSPPSDESKGPAIVQPLPSNEQMAALMGRVAKAIKDHPSVPVYQIAINLAGPRLTVNAGSGGPPGSPSLLIDGQTGQVIPQVAPPKDYHYILQDIHAGYIGGWTGRIISILSGLSLMLLSISGIQMWWDMRRRGKKKGLWW